MNIKTTFLVDYVNSVDRTKKQNKYLWICTIIFVFILIILTFIRVVHGYISWKLCDTYNNNYCNYTILNI